MRNGSVAVAVLLAVAIVALLALPAGAVTWLTVNGATSGTISIPGAIIVRSNASAVGARVRFVIGADLDGSGQVETGEPVLGANGWVQDGGWTDEDGAAGVVQLTDYLDGRVGGSMVIQAVDENGTTVGHVYSMNYTHPAQSVSGTVLYNDGTPGAGLMVSLATDGPFTAYFTDAAGNYVLYLPPGRHPIGAFTNTEGGSSSRSYRGVPIAKWIELAPGEAKTGQNFTMYVAPGPDIVGTVTEADTSNPVPGILVSAEETTTQERVSAFTDINGDYSLRVFAGTWRVRTDVWEDAGPYGNASDQTVPVGSHDVTVDFALPRYTTRIYGIVTGPGGIVIPGVEAQAYDASHDSYFWGRCNAIGRYEIWVPAGSYQVGAYDYVGGNYTLLNSAVRSVTVPPNQQADFSLIARAYTFSGRVVFEGTTTGVPYAELWAEDVFGQYADWFYTTTDGQGYFSGKMPQGTFDGYVLASPWEAFAGPQPLTFPPSLTGVTIPLTPTHFAPTLSGGAVSPASGGVAGQLFTFTVTYTSADNTPPGDVYVVIDSWPQPMDPVNPGDTNYVDGAVYTYQTTLPVGTHSFWFGALDWNMLPARLPASASLSVTAGASGTLKGQVRIMGTTTAIQGVQVKAYLGGVLKGTATTAANGIYQISQGLPAGTYVVSAGKDGYVTQVKSGISVTAGATTYVNFNLTASGTLMGQVRIKGTTTAIPGAEVKAYLGGVLMASGTTDSGGMYTMARDLPTGTYVVAASKSGYVTQTKAGISCTGGATTYVNFNLDLVCLKGQVRIAGTTTNLAGAAVAAYQGDVLKASATTNASGIYEIGGLAAGSYTVVASKVGYVRQAKYNVTVTQGVITYVNFSLAVSGKLKGQVKDKVSGANLIGATVIARSGGIIWATTTTTAPYGVYDIPSDLPAGTYVVGASKIGYLGQTKKDIPVTAGATTYVNFNLQPQL